MKSLSAKSLIICFFSFLILNNGLALFLFAHGAITPASENHSIYLYILASLFISSAITGVGYFLLKKVFFDPLHEVTDKLNGLAAGNYNQHLNYSYQTELTPAVVSLNVLFHKFSRASEFVKHLGTGNLTYQEEDFENNAGFKEDPFIQSLLSTRAALMQNSLEESRNRWVAQGVSQIEELLRLHNLALTELSYKIIACLVKYLGANQGGLFLLNDDDEAHKFLELKACFAYNRKKFLEKRIMPGEGLLGQAAIEKESIYLTQVPHGYTSITSGLGEATPTTVFIVPLKKEDKVIGVIELASFNEFEDYQREFLEKVAQSIAATIINVLVNQRTNKLLETSQQQAEELRAQEEEMRQNMEELGATQEEIARVSAEMEGQLSAINKTMATIEFDLNGNILNANENFQLLMEYNLNEIQGKHHSIFVRSEERQSEEYKTFWKKLSSGENVIGEFQRITRTGKEVFIKGIYNPVLDQAGRPKKILKIAYDISESKEMELLIKSQLEEAQAHEEELRHTM